MASRSSYYADSVATSFYSINSDINPDTNPVATAAPDNQPAWKNPISLVAARKNHGSIVSSQSSFYSDTETTEHAPAPFQQRQRPEHQLASPLTFKGLANTSSNHTNMNSVFNFPHNRYDLHSSTTTSSSQAQNTKSSTSTTEDLIPPSRLVNVRDYNTLSFSSNVNDSDASSLFIFDDTLESNLPAPKGIFDSPRLKASPQLKASFPDEPSNTTKIQDVLPPDPGPFMPHVYRQKSGSKINKKGNSAYNTISDNNNISITSTELSNNHRESGIVLVSLYNSFNDAESSIHSENSVSTNNKDNIYFNTRSGQRQSRVRSGMLPPLNTTYSIYNPPAKRTSFRPRSEAHSFETSSLNSQPLASKLRDNAHIRQELEFARRIKKEMASKSIMDLESALSNFDDDNSTTNLILTSSSSRKATSNVLVDEKSNTRYDKDGTPLCNRSTEMVILLFSFVFPPLWLLLGTGKFDSVIGRVSRQAKIISLILAGLVFAAIVIGVVVGIKQST
jgi:hypothetical protein